MNEFGDERKLDLAGHFSGEVADRMGRIIDEVQPIVLGVTFWRCYRPWQVPERRICDNFILIVADGEEAVSVAGESRVLRRGDMMIVPEFVPHSFGLAENCRESSHFILHVLFELEAGPNPFTGFRSPFRSLRHPEVDLAFLTSVVALRAAHPEAAMRMARWKLLEWMVAGVEEGTYALPGLPVWDERLRSALEFMRKNFRGNIGVPDLARAAHFSEARFRTVFRQAVGMPPGEYLARLRLLHATRRLARYEESLAEVAEKSGFSSASYFCNVFKKAFGSTPEAYRKYIRR